MKAALWLPLVVADVVTCWLKQRQTWFLFPLRAADPSTVLCPCSFLIVLGCLILAILTTFREHEKVSAHWLVILVSCTGHAATFQMSLVLFLQILHGQHVSCPGIDR